MATPKQYTCPVCDDVLLPQPRRHVMASCTCGAMQLDVEEHSTRIIGVLSVELLQVLAVEDPVAYRRVMHVIASVRHERAFK